MDSLSVLFVQNQMCTRTWKQAGALHAGGHKVSLFELSEPSAFRDYGVFAEHHNLDVPGDLRSLVRHQRVIKKALRDHLDAHDYDIVHTANAPDAFGAWTPRVTDVPVVHDVHDIQTEASTVWSNAVYNRIVDQIKIRWERLACQRADGILTTSEYMADYFRAKYGLANVWALENKPFPVTHEPRPKRSRVDGETHLVYAGGITTRAGADRRLLEPFTEIADLGFHVHVYGVFENDSERAEIETAFDGHPRLHIEPLVPQDAFIAEMSQYDAGLIWFTALHANIRSASPNKLFEFQVAGIPVVTNVQEGSIPEHIGRKGCGYVVQDANDLKERFDPAARFTFDPSDCFLTAKDLETVYQHVLVQTARHP